MKQCFAPSPTKGRPREFDLDEALTAALRVFWRNGYESASMAELTAEMGITKPSLYAAFGNKEALFHKALDLYEREKLAYTVAALEAPTARGVAEHFLLGALAIHMNTGDPKGCMGVISTVTCGAEAESIKADLTVRRASSEAALIARFERAQAEGELPEGLTPAALTRFLYAMLQGMSVQSSSGASCVELRQLVDTTMMVWPTR
ncbi:TetR/AcrR family transcriptional regulator [Sphingomonas sp. GB1N7]|uniref:TetR/AcrR family transcriptional regulator n=1 Tax=Parasphingomonas caseinilytica TaxID=3096158 RepID=UPI002FC8652C